METLKLNRKTKRLIERYTQKNISKLSKEDLIEQLTSILEEQEPNLIMLSDAYKYSHHNFYPEGMTKMTSYLESRGGKFQELVMFGLQYLMKKYLVGPVLSMEMVEEAYEKLSGGKRSIWKR